MPNITYNFEGKVVLITGSSNGIGSGIALLFAKSGANVVLNGRNALRLQEVAKECQQISSNNSEPLQVLADITKEKDCKRLVDTTIEKFGKLDILVNNAGGGGPTQITNPNFMDTFKSVMKLNVYSVVYLTHLCVEYLAKTKGNIINISSIASIMSDKNSAPYCVSKSGLDMFTKCMAAELGPKGIRVNSINPGAIRTDVFERSGLQKDQADEMWNNLASRYPLGRVGLPEDIANAVQFLATEESSFITGTIMVTDGGHIAANVKIGFTD